MLTEQQKADVIKRYNNYERVTEIANSYNVSRQAIIKLLRKSGVDTSKHRIQAECKTCGGQLLRNRRKLATTNSLFCCRECYYSFLHRLNFKPSRNGCREAVKIVAQYFCLRPDNVVHHVDGDQSNNELSNLMVFENPKDHLRHHRGFEIKPIWRGDRVK